MASTLVPALTRVLICFFLLLSVFDWREFAEASRQSLLNSKSTWTKSTASTRGRTVYHFQPPRHWINDPNAPMYYNGIYHLFYQYDPYAAVWGNISWGHSVSTNLICWTVLEPALEPSNPFDANGCFSGSATILPSHGPVIVYTGVDKNSTQVQNIAFPRNLSDPLLREWTKPDYNPVMKPAAGMEPGQFRDPSTAWVGQDGWWRIVVGAEIGGKGQALLYRSKDFIHWVQAKNPLDATNATGMWECPDFFSLPGKEMKYVLKMSLGETRCDHYMVGRYDEERDVFVRDETIDDFRMWRRFDYGQFYASKTFFDERLGRRILWGWVTESDSVADDKNKGWSGIQSFPRAVSLDADGRQLLQWPIKEVELVRRKPVYLHDIELSTGSMVEVKGIKAAQADVEVEFELLSLSAAEPFDANWALDPQMACREKGASVNGLAGPFGLLVLASPDLEEHTDVFFRVFKSGVDYKVLMCSDERRSSLRPEVDKPAYGAFVDIDIEKDGKLSLRTLIDRSVVESFGAGGRTCITSRVYPSGSHAHLYVFNNGTTPIKISTLKAWTTVKPPKSDKRLKI